MPAVVDCGGPAGLFDHAVVRSTGEGEVGDVGGAAAFPVVDVVDLGPVAGHGAAGPGAAAGGGVQHDPLRRGGESFGAAEVERLVGVAVEHRQIVVRMAGHPDQVRHRQQAAAAGDPTPADFSSSCSVVETITVTGNPL